MYWMSVTRWRWGPEVNTFEKASSDGHQVSVSGESGTGDIPEVPCVEGTRAKGILYSEFQCIMGSGHIGPSPGQTDTHV